MTNLKKQAFSALAATSLVLSMALPVSAAEMNLTVTGNGVDSDNTVKVENNNTQNVVQNNEAKIENNIQANSSTGGNNASRNTGGNVKVDTGNADTSVNVSNSANTNVANIDCCGAKNTNVTVSGNGDSSDNKVKVEQNSNTKLYQTNDANIKNNIDANSKTGKNDADRNTGGNVKIVTGDATTSVAVDNAANMNSAKIGGGHDAGTGSVSAYITGNGVDSDNDIKLDLDKSVLLTQANDAYVKNSIDADANTGKNDANRNTGGDVIVDTGDADVTVGVDNMANFNAADVDCGCLLDVTGKIAKNGDNSDNRIKANLNDTKDVFQNNDGSLKNKVDANGDTGKNDVDRNTGYAGSDPSVYTGDSSTDVHAENSTNVNALGKNAMDHMPHVDFEFNVSLNLAQLKALLDL
jgi:hypothetical protein